MRERFKRGFAIATAVVYLAAGVVTPAKAFAPPIALGAAAVMLPSGSYAGLSSLAALIGLTGLYFTVQDALGNKVAVPLGTKPENQPPSPAAAPTAAPTGNSGSGAVYSILDGSCSQSGQTSVAGACSAWASCKSSSFAPSANFSGAGVYNNAYCAYSLNGTTYHDVVVTAQTVNNLPTCGSGYTLSGSSCVLSNPRQAADDKRCDMLLSGGQFAMADDLNCSATSDGTKLQPLIRDGKAIAYGKNESTGQPLVFTVSPSTTVNSRDWIEIKVQEQVQTATQTQVKETSILVDPATSQITSVQTQTSPGMITQPTAQTVPTTNTSPSVSTTPTVSTDPTKQTQTETTINTCGLPGQPACAVDDTGFANPSKPWDSTDKPDFDTGKKVMTDWVDPSLSWSDFLPKLTPGAYAACHPLEFRGQVQQYGLDATTQLDICWFFEYIRMFLGYLFGLSAMVYIFRTFTSSQSWEK